MPGGVEPLEGGHHLFYRPGVPHRRAPDLVGQVCGQPGEELLVRLVRVDVLVPAYQPEGGTQPGVLVGAEGWFTAEVRQAGPAVVHVDGRGLAAFDGCDQPPQYAVVQVLFRDGPDGCLDVHVGFLEDVLVQARADGELGVIVAVNEPGQNKMTGRAEDAVEGPALFQVGSRADGGDRALVNDNPPVRDQGLGAQAYDRVPRYQVTGHRMVTSPPAGSPGRCRAHADDGTTIRSSTRRNAALASRSTFCSSTVVS